MTELPKHVQANLAKGRGPGGRPNGLSDPERVKLAAALFMEGRTRAQMAAELGVSEWTITQWRKDPRIRAAVSKLVEDRVMRIVSKTDHIIEGRLQNAEDMDTDTLLKLRKEYLGGAFRVLHEGGKADDATVNEAMTSVEGDPQLVEGLRKLLEERQAAVKLEQEMEDA